MAKNRKTLEITAGQDMSGHIRYRRLTEQEDSFIAKAFFKLIEIMLRSHSRKECTERHKITCIEGMSEFRHLLRWPCLYSDDDTWDWIADMVDPRDELTLERAKEIIAANPALVKTKLSDNYNDFCRWLIKKKGTTTTWGLLRLRDRWVKESHLRFMVQYCCLMVASPKRVETARFNNTYGQSF
jgi:hypothetical protein